MLAAHTIPQSNIATERPTVNNHMFELEPPSTRKRQRSDRSDRDEGLQKKQKAPSPATFWDNLSKIWLTKRALKELDRRNKASVQHPSQSLRRQRPATRDSRRNSRSIQPATDYCSYCGPGTLRDIKAFARHGGPDLSGLRSVCASKERVHHELIAVVSIPKLCVTQ